MQVSIETTSGLERRMTVGIPKDKIDNEIQSRLKSLASRAKVAGFRPGKVPINVIKKKYGGSIKQEVVGELVQSSYIEAIRQENLQPAGMPHIEHRELDEGDVGLEYTATFEIYPDVQLNEISNLEIEKPVADIQDTDIDEVIETIRKQHVKWNAVTREAQLGDKVTLDYDGKIDGESFEGGTGKDLSIELGSKRMIPGFEDQLVGVKVEEERDLTLSFPDDYQAHELAGKPVKFTVKVTKVEAPELPEVNDEFAQTLGIKEGGISAFRDQVKLNMQREVETKIKSIAKKSVMDALLAANQFDVPNVMIDKDVTVLREQSEQQMGKHGEIDATILENQARRRVALGLILSEIVKQNNLKVEPTKLRQFVESISAGYEHPDEVVKYYYSDKQRLGEIENLVLEDEVVSWILSNVKIIEKPVSFSELMNKMG